jgi:hypothetical protein
MRLIPFVGRAYNRLRSRGFHDTAMYSSHVAAGALLTGFYDLWYGRKICRTYPGSNKEREGHFGTEHSSYQVLRRIFLRVHLSPDDVLVDVGCGEGRVINFWLSLGLYNRIIGIEANPDVARDTKRRYRRFSNVSIMQAYAEAIVGEWPHAIFYLGNPFSEQILAKFELALHNSKARIVYTDFHGLTPFENDAWKVEIVRQNEPHWCQYRCAFISRQAPSR